MNGNYKMTGIAGLAWGVLVLLAYIAIFVFVGRAMQGGGGGGATIVLILALLAAVAFIVMLFFLSTIMANPLGRIACYAAIVLQIIVLALQLMQVTGGIQVIILILLGIAVVLVGVFGVMQAGSGAWKAFSILLIVGGALKIIIVGEVIYPFVACAAGIVLFVCMNAAAKRGSV